MGQSFRSQIAAQASAAAAADTFSAGSQTVVSMLTGANAEGAYNHHVELDVSSAPTTATYAELWISESNDGGTSYAAYKYVGTFEDIGTTPDKYSVDIEVFAPTCKFKWKPIDYGMTAALNVRPSYPA